MPTSSFLAKLIGPIRLPSDGGRTLVAARFH